MVEHTAITLRPAHDVDVARIEALLAMAQLPTDGLAQCYGDFVVAEAAGTIVGAGGMERCGAGAALLRSFVVAPAHRGQGIARRMHDALVQRARATGIDTWYLLTTTAQDYFARLGFSAVARDSAPPDIRATQQFRQLCPASALLMRRAVVDGAAVVSAPTAVQEAGGQLFDAGYYCAEAVLLAASRRLGIESPLIPAIATGLCSGVARTGGMCGALSGAILTLNLVFGRERAGDSVEQNYAAVQRLLEAFAAHHGATHCPDLLGCHLGTPEGQQQFRRERLHRRCRDYTASATELAVGLAEGLSSGTSRPAGG